MQSIVKKLSLGLLRILVIATLFVVPVGTGIARADATWTQTSQAEFESGMLFQVDTSSSPGDVKLAKSGAAGNLYALRGNNSRNFWRYNIATDSWGSLAYTPADVKKGGVLAYDGGDDIYAFRGNSRDFWRYSISANSWESKASAPGEVKEGGALAYHPAGYIYALRGNNTRDFWRYDISADSWTSLASTQENVKYGGALTSDGGNYLYAFQCVGTSIFWRYDISADSWALMADTPNSVGSGAALAYDGGNYIYALRGKYSSEFWRYDISADSWSGMSGTPRSVEWGGALAYDGGSYIYALRGKYTHDFWRYDISANSWTWRADTPSSVYYGGALTAGAAPYYASGALTSSAYDTGYAADFGTVSWTATAPAGTSVQFQIATNNDNATWDFVGPDGTSGTYYTSGGQAIWSGHDGDRYIKYKAYLGTTDADKTPVLHDVSLTCTPQVGLPSVTTDDATLVEETTATLHGTVADDGGEACQYRFEYGKVSGGPYPYDTSWTGGKTTGQSFSAGVTGLGKGTKYYFRAQAKNSVGTASGAELSFLTKPDGPASSTFKATFIGDTQITLSWTKGEGAEKTMIRRQIGDFPVDRDDGVLVYFDTGTSFTDTGLSPETTYYYRAWSYVSGSEQWSDGYQEIAVATTGGPPVPPVAVGGTVFGVNKAQVLAPWLVLFLVISLVTGGLALRLRKRV